MNFLKPVSELNIALLIKKTMVGDSNASATGDLLSGKGNSTSVGAGVLSGSRDRTGDGTVKGIFLGPSLSAGYKQSNSQSSTNMKLSPDYKLDPKTDRIVYVGKK